MARLFAFSLCRLAEIGLGFAVVWLAANLGQTLFE